jgi:hypothetical protein
MKVKNLMNINFEINFSKIKLIYLYRTNWFLRHLMIQKSLWYKSDVLLLKMIFTGLVYIFSYINLMLYCIKYL